MTHLLKPKRPTPKIGRNDPGQNDPAETTQPKRPMQAGHPQAETKFPDFSLTKQIQFFTDQNTVVL